MTLPDEGKHKGAQNPIDGTKAKDSESKDGFEIKLERAEESHLE
jgi:hypothetical protein